MSQWMGIVGVGILLVAFVLNLLKVVREDSRSYLAMNLVGASLAAVYAWAGEMLPFVVLECVWAAVAGVRLLAGPKKTPGS